MIPESRINTIHDIEPSSEGRYVLYWMTSSRRVRYNFALQHSVGWARRLRKPLVILEALRLDYPWASVRMHQFVMDGMASNLKTLTGKPVTYYPYLETHAGDGRGLVHSLTGDAAVVVADEFPCFFHPRMIEKAATKIKTRFEQIDGNGLLPLRASDKDYPTAYAFRRFLHKELPQHLSSFPRQNPLKGVTLPQITLPASITDRWPMATAVDLESAGRFPLPALVSSTSARGGEAVGRSVLSGFLRDRFDSYLHERNRPASNGTSNLSPYLHFGHISSHEVFDRLAKAESWTADDLSSKPTGKRSGWWGMSETAEAFIDQFVTWRELGYNFCHHRTDYADYDSLPGWALDTLTAHESDPREYTYELEAFEQARTHDDLWNAAQNQLVNEGIIHNYMRMLWGKKILEWSASPRAALEIMTELNNKYALDGRDPNSYSGIFWVLGRYDRAWGPERPVFGKIRYMSSENTARKFPVGEYLDAHSLSIRS